MTNSQVKLWITAIIALVVVLVSTMTFVAYLKTLSTVPKIAENFMAGKITQTFLESIPTITSTEGDVLEIALLNTDVTLKKEDELTTLWGFVSLGKSVAEIRVPVTYRYHIRLSDTWKLTAREHTCYVLAPQIQPTLPPAFDTARMEKRTERGWGRFDGTQLDELEKGLTHSLKQRAMDPRHMELIREACRKSVAAFVQKWLLKNEHWRTDRFTSITVVFPDEVPSLSESRVLKQPPTLLLEAK